MAPTSIRIILLITISFLFDSPDGLNLFKTVGKAVGKSLGECVMGLCGRVNKTKWSDQRTYEECTISAYSVKGQGRYMEDRYSVMRREKSNLVGFAIYDGHGGWGAAEYAEKNLLPAILDELEQCPTQFCLEILKKTIIASDKKQLARRDMTSGSTMVIGVLKETKLYIANLGDSTAVAHYTTSDSMLPITVDHTLSLEGERDRILSYHGHVTQIGKVDYVEYNGIRLRTTRSLGDAYFKRVAGVISVPYTAMIDWRMQNIDYVILATHSLWEKVGESSAAGIVSGKSDGAKRLVKEALKNGATEDITAVVVKFKRKRK